MNKCIFFDRDGIVNKRIIDDYVKSTDEFIFIDEFISLFKKVKQHGYKAIVITNQQGIGKGLMSENDLTVIHDYMQKELYKQTGFKFDDIYFAPNLKSENSFRRKPNPGMILEAIEKWQINKSTAWMIGDSESDIIAANNAGIKSVFIGDKIVETAEFSFTSLAGLIDSEVIFK